MTIQAGTKLGPYEIIAPLGAGGMGEVYRAKDSRLDRIVAIKVLPAHLSSNEDLRQRFEREARAVSSLNHPNICTLYDVGHQDGIDFLVMEFIEGETLSSRLSKGSLSTSELLRYSIQIADALDKAHKRGIIHRDLKPGNIMLTKSGTKVLDFGLAKMQEQSFADVSQLATAHRELTKEGMILGTVQYMAPEQLEGKETDSRTDIFAFGAIMYEMATGKKAFEGSSNASLIAAILKEDPKPISQMQPLTPLILERLVRTCLAKDPEDRWQSVHDISNELRWISESSGAQNTTGISDPRRSTARKQTLRIGWIVAATVALGWLAFWYWTRVEQTRSAAPEVRFLIPPPDLETNLAGALQGTPDFAVSHDGLKIIYVATDPTGKFQLFVRPLESLTARPIPGTENSTLPFWSPDDKQIAFAVDGVLKKIILPDGTTQTICKIQGNFMGGSWNSNGIIIFGTDHSGLRKVSAQGGEPQALTDLQTAKGELLHSYPSFLPDGKHFLYTSDSQNEEQRGVYLASLDSKNAIRISDSRYKADYLNPGYLLFLRGATLLAQQLQIDPPKLLGEPSEIANIISVSSAANNAPFAASATGTMIYRGGDSWAKTQLAWFSRTGELLGKVGSVESDISVRLSPDGTRAAVASTTGLSYRSGAGEQSVNIYVIDLTRGVRTRVTFNPAISDENPVWSPDGRSLAFASHRSDRASIYMKSSSGEGQDQLLFENLAQNPHPDDWSPDGKFLMIHFNGLAVDLATTAIKDNGGKSNTFTSTQATDIQGRFSPDGRWVAYTSSESGRNEVYVRPFPSGAGKWQISSEGGSEPRWRHDGKELYYMTPDGTLMAVEVTPGETFNAAQPKTLFKTGTLPIPVGAWGGEGQYDVSPNGSKFLINTMVVPPTPANLYVIVAWKPPAKN